MARLFRILVFGILLVGTTFAAGQVTFLRGALAPRSGPALTSAKTWGYQLQNASPDRIPADLDMLVVDYARGARPLDTLPAREVERFRTRPDGRKRIVLAYLSVGEAETYRFYWWSHWRVAGPRWLGRENPEWRSNYQVRYWDKGWQDIIVNPRRSLLEAAVERYAEWHKPYLDRILEAGFDGVYLDRIDAFTEWQSTRPSAEADMMAFVAELSAYAKRRKPGFLIVAQNAEELLEHAPYRRTIDGIAKEDLLFGIARGEAENKPDDVAASVRLLNRALADKLPVFVVEYLADPVKRQRALALGRSRGYVTHFAERSLMLTPEVVPALPTTPMLAPSPPAVQRAPSPARPSNG